MLAPKRLTTARIESTRALWRDVWISDNDGSRGGGRLLVRIGRCGTRLFYFRGSYRRKTHIISLGRYNRTALEGCLTLEQARALARHYGTVLRNPGTVDLRSALGLLSATPTTALKPAPTSRHAASDRTLLDLCNEYVAYLAKHRSRSSAQSTRLDVKNYIAECDWATTEANQVSSKDMMALLRSINEHGRAKKTNRIRSLLMAAYGLAMRAVHNPGLSGDLLRFEVENNPVCFTAKVQTVESRLERALTAAELGQFWQLLTMIPEADAVKYRVVRLTLLLGGQRCTQLLAARTSDISVDSRTLQLFDSKGRRAKPRVHLLPLSPLAWAEIDPLLQEAKALGKKYLFPGRGGGDCHIGEDVISHVVRELSAILLRAGKIEAPFCYRDIRRTAETRMCDLEIDQEVRCQIQSHDMGGVQMAHYNRHAFLPQKRRALEQWQQYLLQCARTAEPPAPQEQHREPGP